MKPITSASLRGVVTEDFIKTDFLSRSPYKTLPWQWGERARDHLHGEQLHVTNAPVAYSCQRRTCVPGKQVQVMQHLAVVNTHAAAPCRKVVSKTDAIDPKVTNPISSGTATALLHVCRRNHVCLCASVIGRSCCGLTGVYRWVNRGKLERSSNSEAVTDTKYINLKAPYCTHFSQLYCFYP